MWLFQVLTAPFHNPGRCRSEGSPLGQADERSAPPPVSVVVMGVSGSGKSTVGAAVARELGWAFAEGDDLHSDQARAKMASGVALTDDDRRPWLARIAAWIRTHEDAGDSSVVTCSALRRAYRDYLRSECPSLAFLYLAADPTILTARLEGRTGHFMPAQLLASQLATLEPLESDERGATITAETATADVVRGCLEAIATLGRDSPAP